MVRLAAVGTGWQGQGLLSAMDGIEQITVAGVCDLNEETLSKAVKKFQLRGFHDYVQMLG